MDILRVKVNGEWTDIPAIIGPHGTTFIPFLDLHGNLSWSNADGKPNPETINIKGPQGETGAAGQAGATGTTFIPYVASNGDISWSNADGKPNPATINIKGPQGETGATGPAGTDGQDGISPEITVYTITGGHEVIITDKDHPSGQSFAVMDGTDGNPGAPGVGVPVGGTTGQVLAKVSNTDYETTWTTPSESPVQDVQVNGVSVLSDGVANVPSANTSTFGVVKIGSVGLMFNTTTGALQVANASDNAVKSGTTTNYVLVPGRQHLSTFYGLAKAAGDTTQSASSNAVGTYTDAAKSAISQMLNSPVTVSGTTPTITALPGIRYICGEVATLDIILPESGIVDVTFESGSTPTLLTITPPTGVTLKWANGFDPDNLEANTTYEINICDGLGVAGAWT